MKILFWLEPHFELNQPGLMCHWLAWFESLAFALVDADANIDFRIVSLDSSSARARKIDLKKRLILLSHTELLAQWRLCGRPFIDLEHDRVQTDLCDQLIVCLRDRLVDFEPDVVFLLNQQPWLRRSFANALFVNIEMSWSSRPPFPSFWHLDISGAGKGRILANYADQILKTTVPDNGENLVGQVRSLARKHLKTSLASNFVDSVRQNYATVRLLPIGAFEFTDDQTTFFVLLDRFLSEQIGESALILTQHPMWKLLNDEQIIYLASKYPCVFDGDDYGSQNLLPWVDCVIGDFSTVSTQALLFDTQIISIRRELHNFPVDSPLVNPLVDLLSNASLAQRDTILYWLLSRYTVTASNLFDGNWLNCFIHRAFGAVRHGEPLAAYDNPIANMIDWSDSQWRYVPTKGVEDSEARIYISEIVDSKPREFSEDRSVGMQYPISGKRQTLRLVMPLDAKPLAAIRLDPASVPVAIYLHGLALMDVDGRHIWQWDGNTNVIQNIVGLSVRYGTAGLLILSFGNDPHFDVKVPNECLATMTENCSLVLDFTPLPLMDVVPEILVHDDQSYAELRSKYDTLTVLPSSCVGTTSVSVKLTSDIENLALLIKDSIDRRDHRISKQDYQLNALRDELMRAEAQLDLLKDLMVGGQEKDRF